MSFLNWKLSPPFYYGWVIMIMVAVGTFAATGLTQLVLGGIQTFILDDTQWKGSSLAFAVTLGTWVSGMTSPFMGRLADRHGPRILMPLGAVIAAASFFILSRSTSIWHFYLAYIFGRGFSNPMLVGVVPRTAVVNFFRRRRNLALAMNSMFRPLGGSVNIQFISMVTLSSGWRTAYFVLGIFALVISVPLGLVMRRRPEDLGLQPDGQNIETTSLNNTGYVGSSSSIEGLQEGEEISWTTQEAIRAPAFWIVGIIAVLSLISSATLGFSMVPYLKDATGMSTVQAAGILSFSTVLSLSNIAWGYLADRYTPKRMLMIALSMTIVLVVYLLFLDSFKEALLFGLMWGLVTGTVGVLEQMLLAQYFGRKSYGSISSLLSPIQMLALGTGPILGAGIRDLTGSYDQLFTGLIGLYVVALLLLIKVRTPVKFEGILN